MNYDFGAYIKEFTKQWVLDVQKRAINKRTIEKKQKWGKTNEKIKNSQLQVFQDWYGQTGRYLSEKCL